MAADDLALLLGFDSLFEVQMEINRPLRAIKEHKYCLLLYYAVLKATKGLNQKYYGQKKRHALHCMI